jgi:uncharacterized DUF497 family protein
MNDGRLLFVVFTELENDEIRLISARDVEGDEEDIYYGRQDGLLYAGGWYRANA